MKPALDPSGLTQHEAGAKMDGGKPDLSLLLDFGRALAAVGAVATRGAAKYTRGGWIKVPNGINRYTAALLRHLFTDDLFDEDGFRHDAQVAWNALARLERILREEEDETTK